MRNQRVEQKKSIKDNWETDNYHAKKHKMSNHREEKNWKNKILKEEDEVTDEDFFRYDEDE